MGVKAIVEDILPCTAMVIIEVCTIFLTIMASTTMSKLGMSSFVFVAYTNALSSIILLPYSYLYHRRDKIQAPLFTFPILSRVFLLGFVGVTIAQNLAFAGLSYSSPIVACGAANMIPAFTFILAIFLRKTRIEYGILFSLIRSSVQMWCMRLKGPSYSLYFKPVGIPTACACGCLLFADTFHYGSMLSAIVCGMGYYTTLWGQLKDIKGSMLPTTTSDEKVPLLQEKEKEEEEGGDSKV